MSLEDIPQSFADFFDINLLSAQVILSIAVIFALLLPTMILLKDKNAPLIYLVMVLLGECLLVGLGWLSFWVLIATVAMMAMGVAFLGGGAITGD